MEFVVVEIMFLASNLKRDGWFYQIDGLSTRLLASPSSFREWFAPFCSPRERHDGFVIQRTSKTGSPVASEGYHNLFKAFSWSAAAPINMFNIKLSTLIRRLMAIDKAMFNTFGPKVDQLAVRQARQHQILYQLTLMGIGKRGSGLQFKGPAKVNNQIKYKFVIHHRYPSLFAQTFFALQPSGLRVFR